MNQTDIGPEAAAKARTRSRWNWPHIRRVLTSVTADTTAILAVCAMLLPFVWLVLTTIKRPVELMAWPPKILPSSLYLENFRKVFATPHLLQYFRNTVVVATLTSLISIALGSMAAYSLARIKLPWNLSGILAIWILLTKMYPAIATAVPYYVLMRNLHLLDTVWALIITYTGFNLPLTVWMMLGFFQGIPEEIELAAIVDGCNLWQRFIHIAIPLAAPGLVATAVLGFIMGWNEFLLAVLLTNIKAKTIPVVVSGYITDSSLDWGEMSSLSAMLVIPVIVLAFAVQRYLVRGLTMGAIKE